ncbi:nardilysin-like [Zophobas morio]|uniref:nardilysin-like n=1 Tax=Zophobas morio TaxID=2755281 RepID=UPI0030835CBC
MKLYHNDSGARRISTVSENKKFRLSMHSDTCRQRQLLYSCARRDHPLHRFSWGNQETLDKNPRECGIEVHSELAKFFKSFYSANIAKLVVVSSESLEVMQSWVVDYFSEMPNLHLERPLFGSPNSRVHAAFDSVAFREVVYITPVQETHEISVIWALPSFGHRYHHKPEAFVSELLGHEGSGSILHLLKEQGWALGLSAGSFQGDSEFDSFGLLYEVLVEATEEGIENFVEVVAVVFQYIRMLLAGPLPARLFEEIEAIASIRFKFHEELDPCELAVDLACSLMNYPVKEVLTGPCLFRAYDEELIRDFLQFLNPESVRVSILSKVFEKKCRNSEKWFGTKHAKEDLQPQWLRTWLFSPVDSRLTLPASNNFIPKDFILITPPLLVPSYPVVIMATPHCRLWHRVDTTFGLPRVIAHFHFVYPFQNMDPRTAVLARLYVMVVNYNLSQTSYAAEVAGFSYSFSDSDGLVLKLSGYNDKLFSLFSCILDAICNFFVDEKTFELCRDALQRELESALLKPSRLSKELRLRILRKDHWSTHNKISGLTGLSHEDLLYFSMRFKETLFVNSLLQGNISADDARRMMLFLLHRVNFGPLPSFMLPESRVTRLLVGDHVVMAPVASDADGNSVVENYYQLGRMSVRRLVVLQLLEYIMCEPCFSQLRTREQLGYAVSCSYRNTDGVLGFSFHVRTPSDKYPVAFVDARIENFLSFFLDYLLNMRAREYETLIEAFIEAALQSHSCLTDEVAQNWVEIYEGTLLFDRHLRIAETAGNITKEELSDVVKNLLLSPNKRRKLSVRVVGKGELTSYKVEKTSLRGDGLLRHHCFEAESLPPLQKGTCACDLFIEDLDLFKSSLSYFSIVQRILI